jgi:hypothetical protein
VGRHEQADKEVGGVRAALVAILDTLFTGAAWGGFALLGVAVITWLLDWGHLLGPIGDGKPSRSARWAAIVGAALLVTGLIGVLLNVGG